MKRKVLFHAGLSLSPDHSSVSCRPWLWHPSLLQPSGSGTNWTRAVEPWKFLHGSQDESFLVALQSTYIRSSISYHMAARQSSVVAMHLIISTRSIPSLCTEKVDPWKLKHFLVGRSKLLALLRWGVPAIQWLVAAAVRSQQPSSSSEELSSSVGLIAGTWRDTRKTQSLSMDRKSGRFCLSNSQPLTICDNNHLKTSPRM